MVGKRRKEKKEKKFFFANEILSHCATLARLAELYLLLQRLFRTVDGGVKHAGHGEDTPDDGAHTREEVQDGLAALRVDYQHRGDLVGEEEPGQALHPSGDLALVLGHGKLVGFQDCSVEVLVLCRHHLQEILVHYGLVCKQ